MGTLSIQKIDSINYDKYVKPHEKWLTNNEERTPYHIIDGQQRLTTCIILIFVLLKAIENKTSSNNVDNIPVGASNLGREKRDFIYNQSPRFEQKVYLLGYDNQEDSNNFLIYNIFEEGLPPTLTTSFYTKNLEQAKYFFECKIQNLPLANLESLYQTLTKKFKFHLHEISNEMEVFVCFETMNNRGKPLSTLELLKNRLIYLTTFFAQEGECLREQINNTWAEIYKQLGKNSKGYVLNDDEFLRAHCIMFFNEINIQYLLHDKFTYNNINPSQIQDIEFTDRTITENEEYNEEYINKQIQKLSPTICTFQDIQKYVSSLRHTAKYWYVIKFPEDAGNILTKQEQNLITDLKLIGSSSFNPLLLATLSKAQELKFTCEEKCKLFQAIERFIFICCRMNLGARSDYQRKTYFTQAHRIYTNGNSNILDDIINMLNLGIEAKQQQAISNFLSEIQKDKRFFSWHTIKYMLYQYEKELCNLHRDKRHYSIDENDNYWKSDTDSTLSLEHIFPQTPTKEYWIQRFGNLKNEEIHFLTHSLGNLCPLSLSVNIQLQNDGYDEKKIDKKDNQGNFIRRGYENGCLSEQEIAKTYLEWTPNAIKERSKHLLEFMQKHWNFKFSEAQINELIEFSE